MGNEYAKPKLIKNAFEVILTSCKLQHFINLAKLVI
jgi:hypothetical protein